MTQGFRPLAPLAAQAADKKKGEDIVLLDVHRLSPVSDYMLLVSVTSPAHLKAIEEEIASAMGAAGVPLLHRDGSDSALWRVLDYGGLLVHLMDPEAREFYALEKLYHDAARRHWEPEPVKKRAKSRASA